VINVIILYNNHAKTIVFKRQATTAW